MLAVLVYRFARTSREQQRLTAALRAAHEIQNRLVPVEIPALGGLHTEIAYRAAEEVGGDFCQVLPRPDGSIFVAIGDVSGKGLQAAMIGAVAVGALRSLADEEIEPAAALERLNHVLLRTESTGFITCLCLILSPNGEIVIANAGHLPPYLNGAEMELEAGLPLGIVDGMSYTQRSFALPDSARLTLVSDGVVEARAADGELFGFERTTKVSHNSASEIAESACRFGQEDDITVITLDWQPLAVAMGA
jgi:serine phosphatase RsbU (regulator of sigma subunit)